MSRKLLSAIMLGCVALAISAGDVVSAKTWTITERQDSLRSKVAKGLKANELTLKEAKKLNGRLDDIAGDINKMKTKNAGKLSYKDEGKIEKRLNGVSVDIDKYELAKRVIAH